MEITCYQLCYTTAAAHGYSIPGRKMYQCDYQNHAVRPVCGATNHLCAALCFPALYCLFLLDAVEQARRRFPTRASCANAQTSTLRSGWQSDGMVIKEEIKNYQKIEKDRQKKLERIKRNVFGATRSSYGSMRCQFSQVSLR